MKDELAQEEAWLKEVVKEEQKRRVMNRSRGSLHEDKDMIVLKNLNAKADKVLERANK